MNNFKLSELTLEFVKDYLKIDYNDDDRELDLYIQASISFIQEHTRLDLAFLDERPDIIIVALMLISHFYENKTLVTSSGRVLSEDFAVQKILGLYRGFL